MREGGKLRIRGKGRKALFIAGAVLLLGAFGAGLHFGGSGFGFGGKGLNGGGSAQPLAAQPSGLVSTASVTASPSAANLSYEIVVNEKRIFLNGQECTLEGLRETLLAGYDGKHVCSLEDRHAIKSVYDACKATLDNLQITYVEK